MSSTLQLSWRSLPDVTWHGVAAYLPAPDVLSLLSTNREWHSAGRNSEALWTTLLSAQFRHFFTEGNDNESADEEANRRVDGGGDDDAIPRRRTRPRRGSSTTMTAAERRRREYLALSYRQELPAVEWTPLRVAPGSGPSAREGHLSCVLDDRYLVITGGFSTDTVVWVKDLRGSDDPRYHGSDFHHLEPSHAVAGAHNNSNNARNDRRRDRQREEAEDNADHGNGDLRSLQFAYGATLTPINGRQAVQFGGFRAGGYSHECSQVAVLTLDVASGNGDGGLPRPRFSVSWQVVTTGSERLPGHDDRESAVRCEAYTKRAYHSATLLLNRYLLVLGGMQSSRSVWRPALLDTHTWRWTIPSRSSSPAVPLDRYVPPRHGHTALWDPKRSRVVVFGGGTGSDLLRSGFDHADVWATTKIPDDSVESLVRLLGWGNDGGDSDDDGPSPWTRIVDASSDPLSPTESLCLGRCHVGHCIAPDTVILAFGSGRPSTNGVLAFVSCFFSSRRCLFCCRSNASFTNGPPTRARRIWQRTRSFGRESAVHCPAPASPRLASFGTRT
jgi:hypothetical protein